jgi:hypothetical protein
MKRINLLIGVFLLILFILFLFQNISAQNIIYTNTQFISLEMLKPNNNSFMINQKLNITNKPIQFPVQGTSSQNSCSGVKKSNISSSKNDPFKKFKTSKQQIEDLKLNKTLPKVVSQKEIKKEKVSKILAEDSKFKEIYNYARELGYTELNKSIEIIYDNGANTTVTVLTSNNNSAIFILNNLFNNTDKNSSTCSKQSFLMKLSSINGTATVTMFDKEGGVVLDLLNGSILYDWGHHSCTWWACEGFCYSTLMDNFYYSTLCGWAFDFCLPVLLDPIPGDEIICIPFILCMAGPAALCAGNCVADQCYWYPCQEDCTDQDTYGSWEYYCNGNNRMKHIYHTAYKCSSSTPMEGSCILDSTNSGWENDTCVAGSCPCTYGCNQATGNCKGAVTCYADSECGNSGWIGSPSCSGGDVWQTWREYTCYNAGTTSSYCDYDDDFILKQECVSGDCSGGECVGDDYCESQDPDYPWLCNENCWGCELGNDDRSICCPDSGDPDWCCMNVGPYCDTSTGDCDVCGGNYPYECNDKCWGCPDGGEACCPTSGDPSYCCRTEIGAICMSNGNCCFPYTETCNNQDDNCDGVIDNFNEGCGVGTCASGTRTCTTGSWSSCTTIGLSSNETCNNIDDDCDGSVDESLTQECGTDIGECIKGTQTCSVGLWENCTGSYAGPVNETCNGLDDNCNNITDEDNVCGNYPNATIINPNNNYISYNGNITFTCSVEDDSNLANITLWHNLNGSSYLYPNETKMITGTSNSTTWIINNIPNETNFMWNCLVYDNDSHWSWGENGPYNINISLGIPNDTHKFYIKNSSEDNVAWLGNLGNIVLKGKCFSGGNCNNPGIDSFIIRNITNNNVAYINSTGDLCIVTGNCSDESTSCNPTRNAFIVRDSSDNNMSYIDFDGDLCLTGKLYENSGYV